MSPGARRILLSVVAIVVVAAAVTLHAEGGLLFDGNLYQPDALFQEYWMRQFNDPKLFTDQLTTDLRARGYFPAGLELVDRAAAHVVDPVTFLDADQGDAVLVVAGIVDGTRLIDNTVVHLSGGGR